MSLVRFFEFGGIDRVREPHLVDPRRAVDAVDLDVVRGSLRGLPVLRQELVLTSGVSGSDPIALPLSTPSGQLEWLTFPFWVSLVEQAAINDAWQRIYWSRDGDGTGGLYYARRGTFNFATAWQLGVPRPTTPPSVTVSGGTGPTEERVYVYCPRTQLGELGPPSPPAAATGNVDGTWTVGSLPTTYSTPSAPIVALEIYRTSIGTTGVDYRYVGEVSLGTTSYVDTLSNSLLAFRSPLPSTWWDPPVAGLKGLVRHPSGSLAAFVDNTIYLSEPWYPHAWPITYAYTVPHAIRALAVFKNAIFIFTTGKMWILVGSHPSSMTLIEGDRAYAVPSNRAIADTSNGLVVGTKDGLVFLSEDANGNLTDEIIELEEWRSHYSNMLEVAANDREIVVFFNSYKGLLIYRRGINDYVATFLSFYNIRHILSIKSTSDIWYEASPSPDRLDLYLSNSFENGRRAWRWASNTVRLAQPENLGILFVEGRHLVSKETAVSEDTYRAYNEDRWSAGPLDVLAEYPLAGQIVEGFPYSSAEPLPPQQPLGGEPLWWVVSSTSEPSELNYLRARVYADDVLRFDEYIQLNRVRRLPSGFRATNWRMELDAGPQIEVTYVALASTIEALKRG